MTRVQTTNYGALATTQFQWATTDDDLFDREFDLYRLAQAVEIHDHSSSHGLAVARVGAGVVDATAMAALAVGTTTLQDLSVTNAKLAAGAVTRDKITYPLIQPTNDMAGGFRMRETANTYALGFYMAANGLAVFGAGTPATVGTNLILGQAGQVSVGTSLGAAFLSVMQNANTVGSGIRLYNTNTGFWSEWINDSSGNLELQVVSGTVPAFTAQNTTAKISVGNNSQFTGRLNLTQGAGTQAEGYYQVFGAGNFSCFVDTNGDVNLKSATTGVVLKHSAQAFHPVNNGQTSLGISTLRWTTLYASSLDISGAATLGSGMAIAGALSGVTTLAMSGALTGVTTINNGGSAATLGSVVSNSVLPVSDGSGNLGSGSQRFSRLFLVDAVGVGMTSNPSYQIQLSLDLAGKPNGGSWTNSSDRKLKQEQSIHDYEGGLATILALRPRHFHWNGLGGIRKSAKKDPYLVGFIADEVKDIAPELYRDSTTYMHEGDDEPTPIGAVNDSALPYMLINAVKELTARLEALEERKN